LIAIKIECRALLLVFPIFCILYFILYNRQIALHTAIEVNKMQNALHSRGFPFGPLGYIGLVSCTRFGSCFG